MDERKIKVPSVPEIVHFAYLPRFWGKAEKEGKSNKMKQYEKKIKKRIGTEPKRKIGEFSGVIYTGLILGK